LHVWYLQEDGSAIKERLPGSPFALKVSEGPASASGSLIKGVEEQLNDGIVPAGQEVTLQPMLRDRFGNPSSAATDDALMARLEAPDGNHEIPLKRLAALGAYSLTCEPRLAGYHAVHLTMDGEPITGSPVHFQVTPAGPNGSRSRLNPPTEPCIADMPCSILLEAIDKFGNPLDRGGATVGARALGPGATTVAIEDNEDGMYLLRFSQAAVGECKIMVRLDNVDMAPISVTFSAAAGGNKDGGKAAAPAAIKASAPSALPPAASAALALDSSAAAQQQPQPQPQRKQSEGSRRGT